MNNVDKLVEFDHAFASTHYLFEFHRVADAVRFAEGCDQHGHTNEALASLVQTVWDAAAHYLVFFRIGREQSRVMYALTPEGVVPEEVLGDLARGAGCDEFQRYRSNWEGRELWRFWWC